jgi:hypothetical protein
VSRDVVKVSDMVVVGKNRMSNRSVHVVLFVAVVSLDGVYTDLTIRVYVRYMVIKIMSEDSGQTDGKEFHAVVGE